MFTLLSDLQIKVRMITSLFKISWSPIKINLIFRKPSIDMAPWSPFFLTRSALSTVLGGSVALYNYEKLLSIEVLSPPPGHLMQAPQKWQRAPYSKNWITGIFLVWAITCLIYYDTVEDNARGNIRKESELYSSQGAGWGISFEIFYPEFYLTDFQTPLYPAGDILAYSLDKILSSYNKLMIYCFVLLCLIIFY